MPTYDYECERCSHIFENFQYFSEPDLENCPECKEGTVTRLTSCPTFYVKGAADTSVLALAEKNTKAMGGKVDEKAGQLAEARQKAAKELADKVGAKLPINTGAAEKLWKK